MTYCHRRSFIQQQKRHGLAHIITTADHNGPLAANCNTAGFDQFHCTGRRAGNKALAVPHQYTADIDFRKAVHILFRQDRLHNGFLVQMFRQRELH